MPDKDYSEAALHGFLRQSALSGLIKPATARSRKLAVEQLVVELKSHERNDLRVVDVEELCSRFHKLQDSTIRPESLDVYQSRMKDALADFIRWTEDPGSFKPRDSEVKAIRESLRKEAPGEALAREELALNPPRSPHDIFPVPIREDRVVYIQNIPLDMTPKEAEKIAAVVRALADPDAD